MTDKRIVLSTAGSEDEARKIALHLVEHQLAACVNIVPRIESIYRWKEKVESSQEYLLLIKTSAERFPQVRDAIRELHSYELPECIAISIEDGSPEYLQWLAYSLVKDDPAQQRISAAVPPCASVPSVVQAFPKALPRRFSRQ